MPEERDHETISTEPLAATLPARPTGMALEVPERVADGGVVRVSAGRSDLRITDPVDQRDGLRRRERQIKAEHGALASWVDAQRAEELVLANRALQTLGRGALSVPLAL